MPIQKDSAGNITIFGANSMRYMRLIAQRGALRLEIVGMRHSQGSAYAAIKREYGFRGNKKRVLEQLEAMIVKEYPTPESAQ